jgi:hypothetical protein
VRTNRARASCPPRDAFIGSDDEEDDLAAVSVLRGGLIEEPAVRLVVIDVELDLDQDDEQRLPALVAEDDDEVDLVVGHGHREGRLGDFDRLRIRNVHADVAQKEGDELWLNAKEIDQDGVLAGRHAHR